MPATAIRLNLGCRNRAIPGFIGIDCDPHDGVDIVADVFDLSRFGDSTVSEIMASHILEHAAHVRTTSILREWARVLEPGGILYVAVPDFARAVELYQKAGMEDWIVNFLWGDQGYGTAFHYAGFDEARLAKILLAAGFSEVSRVELFPIFPANDCSTKVSNFDGRPVSLNLVALRGDR